MIGFGRSSTQVAASHAGVAATPPTVRNKASGTLSSSTSMSLPASVAGDQLAVMVQGNASLPAATAGWTRQWNTATGGGAPYLALYTCTSDGAPGTPLSAAVNGRWIAWAVQNSSGLDVTASAADAGLSQPVVAPSVTTTVADTLLLSGYLAYRISWFPIITLPASQTGTGVSAFGDSDTALVGGSEAVSAAGATGTRSAAVSTTVRWVGGSVAFKP